MATIKQFEELVVWQLARKLSNEVFWQNQTGSFSKDYELKNQINRASGSVMDNIAEGFGRANRTEFILFLGYSAGSITEVKSQLYRAKDREHISQQQFDSLYANADRISKMLFGLSQSLKQSDIRGLRYKAAEDGVDYQTIAFTEGCSQTDTSQLRTSNQKPDTVNRT